MKLKDAVILLTLALVLSICLAAGSPDEALKELQEGSGLRYDPTVVLAFLEAWEQLEP